MQSIVLQCAEAACYITSDLINELQLAVMASHLTAYYDAMMNSLFPFYGHGFCWQSLEGSGYICCTILSWKCFSSNHLHYEHAW